MKAFFEKYRYQFIFLAVSLFLYGNTLNNSFSLDDEFVTGPKNITSKGFKSLIKVFKVFHVSDESGNTYEYRPIVKATFAIEYGLWQENLRMSHLMNVLIYALCLVVLFNLLKLIFKEVSHFILFGVVIVFAFIPVHSEVVASLKNRDVMLSFLFSFAAFSNILRYMDTGKLLRMLLALVLLALALLSKFDVVPMLAIIPIVVYQRYNVNYKKMLLLLAVFVVGYFLYRLTKGSMLNRATMHPARIYQYFENPLFFEKDLISKLSAGFNSMGFYVFMLIFPMKMVCYYGYNTLPLFSFGSMYALVGLITSGVLAYLFFTRFKKPDMLWYGVAFFGFSISMYLNVVTPAAGVVADRFMFFASVGFSLIVVHLLLNVGNTKQKIKALNDLNMYQKTIPALVFVVFSFMIINRNKDWKDKLTLFETDVKKRPESVKLSLLTSAQVITHLNDGSNIIPENKKLEKIRMSEKLLANAIKTDSSCAGCYNNIAFLYLTYERDPAAALPYLRLGFKRDSTKKELACNIGIALYRLGQIEEAKVYLVKAIELDQKHEFSVPYEVIQDLYSKSNPNEGVQFLYKELEKGRMPELMNVLLGKTYFEARDTLNSIKFYKQALVINPNNKTVEDFVTNLEVKYYKSAW